MGSPLAHPSIPSPIEVNTDEAEPLKPKVGNQPHKLKRENENNCYDRDVHRASRGVTEGDHGSHSVFLHPSVQEVPLIPLLRISNGVCQPCNLVSKCPAIDKLTLRGWHSRASLPAHIRLSTKFLME